jgi:hypothetical protein
VEDLAGVRGVEVTTASAGADLGRLGDGSVITLPLREARLYTGARVDIQHHKTGDDAGDEPEIGIGPAVKQLPISGGSAQRYWWTCQLIQARLLRDSMGMTNQPRRRSSSADFARSPLGGPPIRLRHNTASEISHCRARPRGGWSLSNDPPAKPGAFDRWPLKGA